MWTLTFVLNIERACTCCASLYSIRALTAVVCVLRMFFWASSIFQSYLYLKSDVRCYNNVKSTNTAKNEIHIAHYYHIATRDITSLTLVIHNHLQNEPSSLFPDNPEETHEPVLGLQNTYIYITFLIFTDFPRKIEKNLSFFHIIEIYFSKTVRL